MSKIIDFLVVVWATVIAFTAGYIAHSLFGTSGLTSAMIGAAIFVLMFALIFVTVAPARIEKLRKSE